MISKHTKCLEYVCYLNILLVPLLGLRKIALAYQQKKLRYVTQSEQTTNLGGIIVIPQQSTVK